MRPYWQTLWKGGKERRTDLQFCLCHNFIKTFLRTPLLLTNLLLYSRSSLLSTFRSYLKCLLFREPLSDYPVYNDSLQNVCLISGCHKTAHKFIFPQIWRLEVWDKDVNMVRFWWGLSSFLPDDCFPIKSSCGWDRDRQTEKAGWGCRLGMGSQSQFRDGIWTREMSLQDPPSEYLHSIPLIPWRLQRFGCKWLSLCRIESLALNSFQRFKKQNRDKIIRWNEGEV